MNLNINPDWLLRMAEKEQNKIISVGGLVTTIKKVMADMTNKKAIRPKVQYEKISIITYGWEKVSIPAGATHVEAEIDYSNCYYESDPPSCIIRFFRKKEG